MLACDQLHIAALLCTPSAMASFPELMGLWRCNMRTGSELGQSSQIQITHNVMVCWRGKGSENMDLDIAAVIAGPGRRGERTRGE